MDYTLALEITANARNLPVVLNAAGQTINQFGRKAEASFKSIGTGARNVANQVREDWTKAARDNAAAQAYPVRPPADLWRVATGGCWLIMVDSAGVRAAGAALV